MANLEEFPFCIVLIIHDEVTFNDFIVDHLGQFTASFHIGKGRGGISKESTAVLIARIIHQLVKPACKVVINTERDDFAHDLPSTHPFIIIVRFLIISFN